MKELSNKRSLNRQQRQNLGTELLLYKPLSTLTYFFDLQGYESIIDVDLASNFHHSGDVLVVQPEGLLAAFLNVSVVQGDFNHVALLQFHLSRTALANYHIKIFTF